MMVEVRDQFSDLMAEMKSVERLQRWKLRLEIVTMVVILGLAVAVTYAMLALQQRGLL